MRVLKLWKLFEVFQSSFYMSNLKSWSPKKYEDKRPNMYNPNEFIASQNPFYNFIKWIFNLIFLSSQNVLYSFIKWISNLIFSLFKIYSTIFLNEFIMWFFLQDLVYLRLSFKSPQHYGKSRLQWTLLHKIIINHFQN